MTPQVINFKLNADDRGMVYGALTELNLRGIKRTYVVKNWAKGMIRAWHGHKKAETYMHVIKGAAKLAATPMEGVAGEQLIVTLSEYTPGVLYIPAGFYNGSITLEDDTRILVYSTLLLEDVKDDDFRSHYTNFGGDKIWEIKPR